MTGRSVRSLRRMVAVVALICLILGTLPVTAVSATVAPLWARRYDGPGSDNDRATALGVSPDGSTVFVTGSSPGSSGDDDYATMAYDAVTGKRLWERRYDGPRNLGDDARAVAVSPEGSTIFVTGRSGTSSGRTDYATVAYRAGSGIRLWTARYDGGADGRDDAASAIAVTPDGESVFVTGRSGTKWKRSYATVAYDAGTGAERWASRYTGPDGGGYLDGASALAVSPDGSTIFVTGSSSGAGWTDYATVAYDAASGAELWAERYNGPGNEYDGAVALGVMPDGSGVFVTGSSTGTLGDWNFATVLYDSGTGAQVWARRFDGPNNATDQATEADVSPDGSRIFVTGWSSYGNGSYNYATVAYTANGVEQWSRRYDGPANDLDAPGGLGVARDGSSVFVTGTTATSTGDAFGTIAYDAATGVQLWVARYERPGSGYVSVGGLEVSPDGRSLYVAGSTHEAPDGDDYATLAYRVPE